MYVNIFSVLDSGTVWCVANVISGTTNYLTAYNGNDGDAMIDNSAVYRFSCLVGVMSH